MPPPWTSHRLPCENFFHPSDIAEPPVRNSKPQRQRLLCEKLRLRSHGVLHGSNSQGLTHRLEAIESACRLIVSTTSNILGYSEAVHHALSKLPSLVNAMLFDRLIIFAHSDNAIVLRLVVSVDWDRFQLHVSHGDEYIFVGQGSTPADLTYFVTSDLRAFLSRVRHIISIRDICIEYHWSRTAAAKYGVDAINEFAGTEPTNARDAAQRASFIPISRSLSAWDSSLSELTSTIEVGTSEPLF